MLIYFISCYHTKANHQHCCHHVRKRNCQYFSPGTLHRYFCWQGTNSTLFGSSLVFSLTAHSASSLVFSTFCRPLLRGKSHSPDVNHWSLLQSPLLQFWLTNPSQGNSMDCSKILRIPSALSYSPLRKLNVL